MPKKPIRIPHVPLPRELAPLEIAYIDARVNGVRAGDALRRYRPDAWERAQDEAYERGIEPSVRLRAVVREVDQDVCKTLEFAARRFGLHGTARGLRMLPRLDIAETQLVHLAEPAVMVVQPRASKRPTIDELREQHPDFSDEELQQWLDDHHPEPAGGAGALPSPALPEGAPLIGPKYTSVPPRAARGQRVVTMAKRCLERLTAVQPPCPADFLHVWLPAKFAQRLAAHGVLTVNQLMARVSSGERWYEADGMTGLGPVKARLLEDWLREQRLMPSRAPRRYQPPAPSPALPAAPAKLQAEPSPAQLASPHDDPTTALTVFASVPTLSGATGKHRMPAEQCLVDARNDIEAITAWLATLKSAETFRAYRREAVRLVLWATLKRHKPMSSLAVEDCTAYVEFLRAIPADWRCAPEDRTQELLSVRWCPFDRPALSERSIGYALTVLQRLFRWLGDMRYLAGNPWKGLGPAHRGLTASINAEERHLPQALADEVLARVAKVDDSAKDGLRRSRRRIVCAVLFDAGLRRHELAKLTYGCVAYVGTSADGMSPYELRFIGKGAAKRNVPITNRMLQWMEADLRLRGFTPDATAAENEAVPVVGRVKGEDLGCVKPERVYDEVRAVLRGIASELEAERRADEAKLLRKATTHWARHTYATTVAADAPIQVVQSLLGHADVSTTMVYAKVGAAARANAVSGSGVARRP